MGALALSAISRELGISGPIMIVSDGYRPDNLQILLVHDLIAQTI